MPLNSAASGDFEAKRPANPRASWSRSPAASTSRRSTARFLFSHGGSPAEYGAGMKLAIVGGWLVMHESGTFVRFTQAGADLFA